jgi:hypothetical protein
VTRPGQWGNPEIEVRAEGQGRPVAFVATPGQRHAATAFDRLIGQGAAEGAPAAVRGRQGQQQPGDPDAPTAVRHPDDDPAEGGRAAMDGASA